MPENSRWGDLAVSVDPLSDNLERLVVLVPIELEWPECLQGPFPMTVAKVVPLHGGASASMCTVGGRTPNAHQCVEGTIRRHPYWALPCAVSRIFSGAIVVPSHTSAAAGTPHPKKATIVRFNTSLLASCVVVAQSSVEM